MARSESAHGFSVMAARVVAAVAMWMLPGLVLGDEPVYTSEFHRELCTFTAIKINVLKTISYRILTGFMSLLLTSGALMSYTTHRGGEGFELLLNNKLVVQLFGKNMNGASTLYLEPGVNNEISIGYHHCGNTGKSRRIDIKNEKGEIIKTWRFADNAAPGNAMKFKINEAPGLKLLAGQVRWSINYTSSELPDGRQLALLANGITATAKR